jgi:hypothetical protein
MKNIKNMLYASSISSGKVGKCRKGSITGGEKKTGNEYVYRYGLISLCKFGI